MQAQTSSPVEVRMDGRVVWARLIGWEGDFARVLPTEADSPEVHIGLADVLKAECACCEAVAPGAPGAGGSPWICNECGGPA